MLKKLSVVLFVLIIAVIGFAKDDQVFFPNYDLAPGAVPGTPQPTDAQWDIIYDYAQLETLTGDNGLLGMAFDGTNLWVSGRGVLPGNINKFYLFNTTGTTMVTSFNTGTATAWGVRDMCFDGTYMYGGYETGLGCWDVTTHALLTTIPFPAGMSFPRANAYNPATDHFFGGNFATPCYEQTRTGALVRQWAPAPLTAVYGMAWDADATNGPWLWVHDQTNPASGCNIWQVDPTTLTYTGVHVTIDVPSSAADMAGGLEYAGGVNPVYTTMLVFNQGTPDGAVACEMYLDVPINAPSFPTNFTVTSVGSSLTATMNWTNPTTTVGGAALTSLTGIKVKVDGNLVYTLTPTTPGAACNYSYTVPAVGSHVFSLIPYITGIGDGQPATITRWIGLDVPAAPTALTVEPIGTTLAANLAWTAPTAGLHGGYFTGCNGYYIYRAPQGGTLAQIGTSATTSFTDNTIPSQGWYFYAVAGYNNSGTGDHIQSNNVFIGESEFEPIAYNWVEVSQIGTAIPFTSDDQNLGPFNIGMGFPWYDGTVYTTFRACTNGWISFTSTATVYSNVTIPTAAEPNNLVAPYWDDMTFSTTGDVYYYYDAANSRCIIEYLRVPHLSYTASSFTFEIILEDNGDVIYMYQEINPSTMTPFPSATVGKENAAGTAGVLCTFNGSGPLEPLANTGIIIYGTPPPVHDVTITLTPVSLPIVIPAGGGSFNFNIAVHNNETSPVVTGVWTNVTLPNASIYGPIINSTFNIAGGASPNRDRVQNVPASAPAGNYIYHGYTGIYPAVVWDDASFPFSKAGVDGIGGNWLNWGEAFPGEVITTPETPTSYALLDAYPNPFNPVANISFDLPEQSFVNLVVYDVSGREVATLVNDVVSEGSHTIVFHAEGLASGVYFYRLTAGDFTSVKKMILMK